MSTAGVLDDLASINIDRSHHSKHDSKFGLRAACCLDESAMITVMEDSSMEYVLVASDIPQDATFRPFQSSPENTPEDEEFVFVSDDDPERSSPWWKSLRKYVYLAARQGGEWSNNFLTRTPPSCTAFHPRHSSIHESYDWVSFTTAEGGRLILPGQLITLDEHPALCQDISSASIIMVSAHDLLACQAPNQECDVTPVSFSTSSSPRVVMELLKQRTLDLVKGSTNSFTRSTFDVSKHTKQFLVSWEHKTGLVANTVGWIHQTMEWCNPASIKDEKFEMDSSSSWSDREIVELSVLNGKQVRNLQQTKSFEGSFP